MLEQVWAVPTMTGGSYIMLFGEFLLKIVVIL